MGSFGKALKVNFVPQLGDHYKEDNRTKSKQADQQIR